MITKIISGGQTGADQGGLDAAIELGIPHGGFCPKGRISENGTIPEKYNLTEHKTEKYPPRTEANIKHSDVTIIFSYDRFLDRGSALTCRLCAKHEKHCLVVSKSLASNISTTHNIKEIVDFIKLHNPKTINIAGNRESKTPGMQVYVKNVLLEVFKQVDYQKSTTHTINTL